MVQRDRQDEARNEAVDGLQRWHNEYNVRTLGANREATTMSWDLVARLPALLDRLISSVCVTLQVGRSTEIRTQTF